MVRLRTTLNRGCRVIKGPQALATIATALVLIFSAMPATNAMIMDSHVYGQYQASRTLLLNKERTLQKDCDDLQKQIDDLQRRRDESIQGQVNDLCRSLDQKYSDLRRVRLDLRDIELKML